MEDREAEKRPLLVNAIKEELGNNEGQGISGSCNQEPASPSPFNFVVFLSTFSVYLGCFATGNMVGFSSPAEYGILSDLGLTLAEYSIFVSIYLAGAILGAMWTGKIADLIGRRGELRVVNLICIAGWLITALSQGALWLDVGRLLQGFGIGLSIYGAIIYIAEIVPKNIRGAVMSAMLLVISCGKALFFVIGPILNWRALALIGIVPFLLQLLCLFVVPESPIWLMKIGKAEECEKALRRIRGANADISQEKAEIKDYTEYSKSVSGDGILSLFHKKYAHCLIIGLGLVVLQQFGGFSGVIFYTSSVLDSAGFSGKIGSMAVGTTQILSSILAVCFVDRLGRRPLLLISSAGTCLGCVLIGLSFLFEIYMGFFSLGMEGIPVIISSEIFPVNIKGVAGSIVNVVSMGGGWIVSITFNFMFTWSSSGTFFIFAAICSANVLFIWKMVPETKGRSLEEIQESIIQTERLNQLFHE